jgi:hypothetical protein
MKRFLPEISLHFAFHTWQFSLSSKTENRNLQAQGMNQVDRRISRVVSPNHSPAS